MASSASIEQCTAQISIYPSNYKMEERTLHRRKAKLLGNFGVTNPTGIVKAHPTDQLGEITRAGDGAAATEGLELDVADLVGFRVDLDLKLHHITAGWGTDETRADVFVSLLEGADVTGVAVVVKQCRKSALLSHHFPKGGRHIFLVVASCLNRR